MEHDLRPTPDDDHSPLDHEVDALFRSGSPPRVGKPVLERLCSSVLRQLERRRRRLRRARRWATVATAAASVIVAITILAHRFGRPSSVTPDVSTKAEQEASGHRDHETTAPELATTSRTPEEVIHVAVDRALSARKEIKDALTLLLEAGPEIVPSLLDFAQSAKPDRARAAVDLLLRLNWPTADEAILDHLAGAPDSRITEWTLEILFTQRRSAGRRLLAGVLQIDGVNLRALDSLEKTSGSLFQFVLQQAINSDSIALRARALEVLASRSPRRAARLFWRACRRYGQEERQGGLQATGSLAEFLAAALARLSSQTLELLAEDIRRGSLSRRRASEVRSFGEAWRRMSTPAVSWEERFVLALGRCRQPEAWPLVAAVLETRGPDPITIRAAGELGDPRALPWLRRWLYLSDERGEAVIEALSRIHGERAVRLLLSTIATSAPGELWPGFREKIEAALIQREDEVFGYLRTACRSDPGRQEALSALVALFPEKAGPELSELLSTVPRQSRPLVIGALARLKTPRAVKALLHALEDPELHRMARQSLRHIARKDFGPSLLAWRRWFEEFSISKGRRTSFQRWGGRRVLIANQPVPLKEAS